MLIQLPCQVGEQQNHLHGLSGRFVFYKSKRATILHPGQSRPGRHPHPRMIPVLQQLRQGRKQDHQQYLNQLRPRRDYLHQIEFANLELILNK